jgi:hypothetical protein
MKSRSRLTTFGMAVVLGLAFFIIVAILTLSTLAYSVLARAGTNGLALTAQDAPERKPGQGPGEGRAPLFGKITVVQSGSIEITNVDGQAVSIKLTDKTEFRKDRQPAKRTDFKVGDLILVRGEENGDHTWTAQVIAARSMNGGGRGGFGGPGGPGGRERGEFSQQVGTVGKDYVAGEVKSVDAPNLSVLRTDKVTQTIELNEDTSLRKGRESITMADIRPGDHVFARGAMENDTFVPKTVMVIGTEQWKRILEWSQGTGGERRRRPAGSTAPGGAATDAGSAPSEPGAPGTPSPSTAPNQQKPPEPQN